MHGNASDPFRHIAGFETDDIDADFARLKGQGAEFIEEPTTHGGGVRITIFKDSKGNILQLFQFSGLM